MSDFHSLLSVFRDATGAPADSSTKVNDDAKHTAASSNNGPKNERLPMNADGVDLTSTSDPSYSAPAMKAHVERLLRITSIRKSTSLATKSETISNSSGQRDSLHIAVCATIVQDFPHEKLWKKWIEETGGRVNFSVGNTSSNDSPVRPSIKASAELYVHAKKPEGIQSEWLKSKTLPITHRPNWNDVRIIRAMLSLIEMALKDENTTHILFCTESCVPVVTLKEAAASILMDKPCIWEENSNASNLDTQTLSNESIDWDRSYVDCYDGNSHRCSRFDEHNCWGNLRDSIPSEAIYKALPGWCLLSRKHAQNILDLPSQLGEMNLWPAFEKVWAPEEVYFPTALHICGLMDEVVRRTVTHSKWDHKAANLQDRAHPLCYDGNFDYELVSQVRRNGCLFLRKMKQSIFLEVWQDIVIRHKKGCDRKISPAANGSTKRERNWDESRNRANDNRHHGGYSRDRGSPYRSRHDSYNDDRRRNASHRHVSSDRRSYGSNARYQGEEQHWKRRR